MTTFTHYDGGGGQAGFGRGGGGSGGGSGGGMGRVGSAFGRPPARPTNSPSEQRPLQSQQTQARPEERTSESPGPVDPQQLLTDDLKAIEYYYQQHRSVPTFVCTCNVRSTRTMQYLPTRV